MKRRNSFMIPDNQIRSPSSHPREINGGILLTQKKIFSFFSYFILNFHLTFSLLLLFKQVDFNIEKKNYKGAVNSCADFEDWRRSRDLFVPPPTQSAGLSIE